MEISPPLVSPAKWDKLMVCTDGSTEGQNAVAVTLQLARACRSHVVVVQVLIQEEQALGPNLRARMVEEVQKNIETIKVAAAKLQVSIQAAVPESSRSPAAILSEVEKTRPDLIIMGRRGKTAVDRLLMGSVTAQVIGNSPINVMVVPLGAMAGFQRLLVALDGSPYSQAAWKLALAMAKQARSQLISVAVARKEGDLGNAKAIIQKMFTAAKEAGMPLKWVKGISLQGVFPDVGIIQEAIRNEVDLIIMGSHGRTGLKKLLMGSTAEKVIGHAPCPVLVVKI
jgi:nucleotide-binding universal stress UspA family protein